MREGPSSVNTTPSKMSDLALFTKTADFAAKKHRDQRRKNTEAAPYINHPIGVAYLATSVGGVTDLVIVQVRTRFTSLSPILCIRIVCGPQ